MLKRLARHVYPFGRLIEQREQALRHIAELKQDAARLRETLDSRESELEQTRKTLADSRGQLRSAAAAAQQSQEREHAANLQREELEGHLRQCKADLAQRDQAIEALEALPKRAPCEKPAFAHWGEDMVAAHFLSEVEHGFYVDLGCYHPSLYSNTKLLHDRGWSGINVDPNPFMMQEFARERPADINLGIAIGAEEGVADLVVFHDWASSNTISPDFADYIAKRHNITAEQVIRTPVRPLREVLREHARERRIDFLNIDIESIDIQALESNDWERYRPALLAIEDFDFEFPAPQTSAIYRFLIDHGYQMVSRCVYTSFFIDATLPEDDPVYKQHARRPGTREH